MTVLKNIAKDRILQITVLITVVSLFFARPRLADINFHTLWSVAAMLKHPDLCLFARSGCFSVQTYEYRR